MQHQRLERRTVTHRELHVANGILAVGFRDRSIDGLVAMGKEKPGAVKFASGGSQSSGHLVQEMLMLESGASFLHVPYQGINKAIIATVAGETDFVAASPASAAAYHESGQLRPLAFTGQERSPIVPDVPTMVEAGFPEFVASAWFGVFARAGTPEDRAEKLDNMIAAAIEDDAFQTRITELGLTIRNLNRAEFSEVIAADTPRWQRTIENLEAGE
nr:hypothetical protein [uncultured bacterium]BAH89938.1 hypothetical protein [uncultured bacterium]BAH90354.1 hypothetical protein [uncultured bacterium]